MVPRPADPPGRLRFTAKARCCTYQPTLPNWAVGAALIAGGPGSTAIRQRLTEPDGLDRLGIAPPARLRGPAGAGFGRDDSHTCPYWVEGPLGCSVHAHRNGVCRTWSCKTTHGARGMAAWTAVRDVLRSAEDTLAERVAGEPDGDWEAYYRGCAERARAIDPAELRTPRNTTLLGFALDRLRRRDRPLPLRPTPALRSWVVHPDRVDLVSWSPYDVVEAPPGVFQLLGRLDGQTPWPDAVRAAEAELGASLPADLVARLWWRGLPWPHRSRG